MYLIHCLAPTDISIGAHGFQIDLSDEFKVAVSRSGLSQEKIDQHIKACGDDWLKSCGYKIDLYDSKFLRVKWGEWGPEHICVPGNACGLDISRSAFGCVFDGGVTLQPHNVDCWSQKQLLLIVFTEIAYNIALFGIQK